MYVRTVQRNIAARSCNVYTSSATLTDLDHFSLLGAIHSQLNWAILLCDVIPDRKTE